MQQQVKISKPSPAPISKASQKTKIEEIFGMVFAAIFILFIVTLVYMKYSGNCGILGGTVQGMVGGFLCETEEGAIPAMTMLDSDYSPPASANLNSKLASVNDVNKQLQGAGNGGGNGGNPSLASVSNKLAQNDVDDDMDMAPSFGDSADSAATPGAATTMGVSDAAPNVEESYTAQGLLQAENVTITSLLRAPVKSIALKEGQSFSKGDVLATSSCDKYVTAQEKADKEHKKKKADFEAKKKANDDAKSANPNSPIYPYPPHVVDQLKADVEILSSNKQAADQDVAKCVIKAGHKGKVISVEASAGQHLEAGGTILEVNNLENLRVVAYINTAWLDWLAVGTGFKVCFSTNKCYNGTVTEIGGNVDASTQTIDIYGKISDAADDNRLIPGLSGDVKFSKG